MEYDQPGSYSKIRSNYGRKVGEPKLSKEDLQLWSKYYHNTYGGNTISNPYYKNMYYQNAKQIQTKQKDVLGRTDELREILRKDQDRLMDHTALMEDQHDTLYRLNQDPYYEALLLKYPNYRDNASYFPRRKEINQRLSKLDSFYREKMRWSEENMMAKRNQEWLDSYLTKREKDREKPKETLSHLKRYLDETGMANKKIASDYENLKFKHQDLDHVLSQQKDTIRKLEQKLTNTTEETNKRATTLRQKYEEEADMLSNKIAHEKMLRHSMSARLESLFQPAPPPPPHGRLLLAPVADYSYSYFDTLPPSLNI